VNINQNWLDSLKSLGLATEKSDLFLEKLKKRYQSRGRYYHNLSHIEALLTSLQAQWQDLAKPEAVLLAIWYHDAIYSPLRKDNEARSARLARQDLQQFGADTALCERIAYLILQTANHTQAPTHQDHDLGWFLDFDLEILGATQPAYQRYAHQIRQEYKLIPLGVYRKGRIQVLKRMLQTPYLYHSPLYRKRYERQARQNLLAEIADLQDQETLLDRLQRSD